MVVSIRVPAGLPDELRQLTGIPFSTLMRFQAITLLNNERRRLRGQPPTTNPLSVPTEENTNVD